ncbi:MAG: acyl carrier protein [Acidobacteria bacterium]|nr:acyl carrier protein [Acidobacteriota bacterium]
MNREGLRAELLRLLGHLAPEADLSTWRDEWPIREELDLDSVDFYAFILAIHQQLGISVPEADYARLSTLQTTLDYLEPKLVAPQSH